MHLAAAGDLWTVGAADLTDLLTEHGDVDPQAVEDRVAELVRARPGLAKGAQLPGHRTSVRAPWASPGRGRSGGAPC